MNPFIKKIIKLFREYKYKGIKSDFILSSNDPVQKKGALISKDVFNGGPIQYFSVIGRLYLITLLKLGLTPESKVLDIGCGALRGGYWLIHFLNPNNYYGIEPNQKMLETGKRLMLEDETIECKKPEFDNNSDFDFSVFKQKFDYIVARSVWTHASKTQIQKMLDEFILNTRPSGVFLTSYAKPFFKNQDYHGEKWVGHSHNSHIGGVVYHNFLWIEKECKKRSLEVRELKFDYINQIWIYINRNKIL